MKEKALLTVASLLSPLFLTFHLTDDIVRGFEKGGLANLIVVPIVVLWIYAALLLTERISGYVIIFLLSALGVLVPVLHMMGKGVGAGSRVFGTSGSFLFVWTLLAIGTTSLFSVILCVRGLWSRPWRRPQ